MSAIDEGRRGVIKGSAGGRPHYLPQVSLACALLAGALTAFPAARVAPGERSKPNLLLITIDTLRADRVGCYGDGPVKTPTIDVAAHPVGA